MVIPRINPEFSTKTSAGFGTDLQLQKYPEIGISFIFDQNHLFKFRIVSWKMIILPALLLIRLQHASFCKVKRVAWDSSSLLAKLVQFQSWNTRFQRESRLARFFDFASLANIFFKWKSALHIFGWNHAWTTWIISYYLENIWKSIQNNLHLNTIYL